MLNKCTYCGETNHTSITCFKKPKKRIKQRGKQSLRYEEWRNTIAYPYVYEKQNGRCLDSNVKLDYGRGDLHHTKGRGEFKYDKKTLVLLTRKAHQARHGIEWDCGIMKTPIDSTGAYDNLSSVMCLVAINKH